MFFFLLTETAKKSQSSTLNQKSSVRQPYTRSPKTQLRQNRSTPNQHRNSNQIKSGDLNDSSIQSSDDKESLTSRVNSSTNNRDRRETEKGSKDQNEDTRNHNVIESRRNIRNGHHVNLSRARLRSSSSLLRGGHNQEDIQEEEEGEDEEENRERSTRLTESSIRKHEKDLKNKNIESGLQKFSDLGSSIDSSLDSAHLRRLLSSSSRQDSSGSHISSISDSSSSDFWKFLNRDSSKSSLYRNLLNRRQSEASFAGSDFSVGTSASGRWNSVLIKLAEKRGKTFFLCF